jgi:DNA-binding transcriptional ArsR family regulator
MQARYQAFMFMVMILIAIMDTGSIGSTIVISNSMGDGASTAQLPDAGCMGGMDVITPSYSLLIHNVFEANVDDLFFNTPYVSRARSQVHQNENRNTILNFISGNPGSTSYDISKGLSMNLGTVRYHLMILDINHLVATYHDGARRIRYFTNNNSYSEDQMKIISLLKREPTSKLLGALSGNTAMSNANITVKSGLSYSNVNRYLKELVSGDVVIKEPAGSGKYLYRISPVLEDQVIKNIR